MFDILSHHKNANQKYFKISSYPSQCGLDRQTNKMMINSSTDRGKGGCLLISFGNANWCSQCGNNKKLGKNIYRMIQFYHFWSYTQMTPYSPTIEMFAHLSMSIAAQFTTNRKLRQPRHLSTDEWLIRLQYIYTVEYYFSTKQNEIIKFTGKQTNLETILCQITQTQKDKHHIFSLIFGCRFESSDSSTLEVLKCSYPTSCQQCPYQTPWAIK